MVKRGSESVSGATATKKKLKTETVTQSNFVKTLKKKGHGETAWYEYLNQTNITDPTVGAAGIWCQNLTTPLNMSAHFGTDNTVLSKEKTVQAKYMRLAFSIDTTFVTRASNFHCFVLSLTGAGLTFLGADPVLTAAKFIEGTTHLYHLGGLVMLNPDLFTIHKAIRKTMGPKPTPSTLTEKITNISDGNLYQNFSVKFDVGFTNTTGTWKNIEEKALKANQRRYLVIFQACISNVQDQGASVAANAMVKYAF